MTGLLLGTVWTGASVTTPRPCSTGEALLGVINDILDFSKVEVGRLEFECIEFDLRGVVEDVAQLLAEPEQEKGLELICLLPPDLPVALNGDPGRLRQVLTNIVGNG